MKFISLSSILFLILTLNNNLLIGQRKGSFGVVLGVVGLERNFDKFFNQTTFPGTNLTLRYGISRGFMKELFLKNNSFLSTGLIYNTRAYAIKEVSEVLGSYSSSISSNTKLRKIEIPIQYRKYIPINPNLNFVFGLGISLDFFWYNNRPFGGGFSSSYGTIIVTNAFWKIENKNFVNPCFIPGIYLQYKSLGRSICLFGITGHIYTECIRIYSNSKYVNVPLGVNFNAEKTSEYFSPYYFAFQIQYMFSRK
jgi:hypothetical protein